MTRVARIVPTFVVGFGDATIAAYVERTGLGYVYAADADDFAVFDRVTPFDIPTDPFDPGS